MAVSILRLCVIPRCTHPDEVLRRVIVVEVEATENNEQHQDEQRHDRRHLLLRNCDRYDVAEALRRKSCEDSENDEEEPVDEAGMEVGHEVYHRAEQLPRILTSNNQQMQFRMNVPVGMPL